MIRHLTLLALASAPIFAWTDSLSAQQISSPYRFIETRHSAGPFVGYLATDRGASGQGPHSAPIFGARYVLRFTGPLSGEVALSGVSTERTVLARPAGGVDTIPPVALGEAGMFLMIADAGLRFSITGPRTWNGIAPFLSAGGGVIINLAGAGGLDEAIPQEQRVPLGPAFALKVGAGTDWFLTDRFSLRAEVHDYLWRLTVPEGLSESLRRETTWSNNIALNFGGALHF